MDVELIKTIANLGFPAVVAMFLLLRLNGTVGKLREAITENTSATREMADSMRRAVERLERT